MLCESTLPTNLGGKRARGADVCSATALRRALPADRAEIVCFCSSILAGKVSGARLNDTQPNFKTFASGFHGIVLAQLAFAGLMIMALRLPQNDKC